MNGVTSLTAVAVEPSFRRPSEEIMNFPGLIKPCNPTVSCCKKNGSMIEYYIFERTVPSDSPPPGKTVAPVALPQASK